MIRFFRKLTNKQNSTNPTTSKPEPSIPNITWQHTWSIDETRAALKESTFAAMPNEIILRIFQPLSVPDLCNISLVCRLFKMIAVRDEIWKVKCNPSIKLYSKSFKQMYMEWIYWKYIRNTEVPRRNDRESSANIDYGFPSYPLRPTGKHQFEAVGGFHQHPNSSASMTIKLSVDLEKTVRVLIDLLENTSQFQQQWQQSSILKQMITRYYRFMQLKAFHSSNILLIPTIDIEIVWQTHLLRPKMYEADCLRLFQRVIDHSLLLSDFEMFLKDQAFRDTCQLYAERFGEQYCPLPSFTNTKSTILNFSLYQFKTDNYICLNYSYWHKSSFDFLSEPSKDYENPFSFTEDDLIMDGKWLDHCKKFMSDALKKTPLGNSYRRDTTRVDLERETTEHLKKSYERFLYMAAKYPVQHDNDLIHPTYAIDMMWHCHMQEPLNYIADCVRIVGYVIHHSPWPMVEARNQMDDIWKDEFDADVMTDHLYRTTYDNDRNIYHH